MPKLKERPNADQLLRELDLPQLRLDIQEKETALEALIADARKEIDALKILERAADVLVNGKPARAKPQRKPKAAPVGGNGEETDDDGLRIKISDFIMQNGPQSAPAIAEHVGGSAYYVKKALDHEWFRREGEGRHTLYHNANVKD